MYNFENDLANNFDFGKIIIIKKITISTTYTFLLKLVALCSYFLNFKALWNDDIMSGRTRLYNNVEIKTYYDVAKANLNSNLELCPCMGRNCI